MRAVEEPVLSVAEGTPAMLVGRCSSELSGHRPQGKSKSHSLRCATPDFLFELGGVDQRRAALRKAAYVALGGNRVRYARDDKVKGGGSPQQQWKWMDRVKKLI